MKILILSDIHANWPALQAVLAAEPIIDDYIVLGDLVNYGPHPVECVRWVRENVSTDWTVQGNHDWAVGCGGDPCCSAAYREIAAATQHYTTDLLDASAKGYLAGLATTQKNEIGYARCYLCHAIPSDPLYGDLESKNSRERWEDEVKAAGKPDYLLVGHTHRPRFSMINTTIVINPGSVGLPKDGDASASYALWDNGDVHLRRASYDVESVRRDLAALAPEPIVRQLSSILSTGGRLSPVAL